MKNLLYLSALVLLIAACKKKDPEPVAEPLTTGTISGKTTQYNQYGGVSTTDLNNVTVSLDNDVVTAVTDNAGNYSLNGVKPGIYTIFFTKPGCGVYQIQQVNFPGNGTLYENAEVIEKPTFSFLSATAVIDTAHTFPSSETFIKITVKVNPNSNALNGTVILSSAEDLDINKPTSYQRVFGFTIPEGNSEGSVSVYYNSLSGSTGNNIYAKIYTSAGYTNSYHDYASNSNIILGYGAASLPVIKVK